MSNYKKSLLSQFGLGVTKFSFNDLVLRAGEKLPEAIRDQVVYIRKLSGAQFEEFAAQHADLGKDDGTLAGRKFQGVRAKLIALCLCDPDGANLFEDAEECNQQLTNEFIGACFVACQQVNGIGAQAQEEAEKN